MALCRQGLVRRKGGLAALVAEQFPLEPDFQDGVGDDYPLLFQFDQFFFHQGLLDDAYVGGRTEMVSLQNFLR